MEERVRYFSSNGVDLEENSIVRGISATRAGVTILLLDGLFRMLLQWINYPIRNRNLERSQISMSDLYGYVVILLISHAMRIGFEHSIKIIGQLGSIAPSL